MKSVYWVLPLILLISSCGGESGKKYIGLWEEENNDYHQFIKISREGDNLVFTDGVRVTAEGVNTENGKSFALTRQGEQWIGPLGMAFALTDDDKLIFAGDSYSRAGDARIAGLQKEVARADAERERKRAEIEAENARIQQEHKQRMKLIAENKPACDALMSEYKAKRQDIYRATRPASERAKKKQLVENLSMEYKEKQKAIPGCNRYI